LPQGRISQAIYFNWKRKYDGLLPREMRWLKQLEDEINKLWRVVADYWTSLIRAELRDGISTLVKSFALLSPPLNIHGPSSPDFTKLVAETGAAHLQQLPHPGLFN
jgi:hypothetical protein